jgi:thiosulfate/3-mercaptopyruvate sulfurtransferase
MSEQYLSHSHQKRSCSFVSLMSVVCAFVCCCNFDSMKLLTRMKVVRSFSTVIPVISPPLIDGKSVLEWYKERPEGLVFVDGSWHLDKARNANRQEEFRSERLPGAVFFDIDEICDKQTTLPHMLPTPQEFASNMQTLGVSHTSRVVVYTHSGAMSAARVWWTFRVFGHLNVSVLNGGISAWKGVGGAIESGPLAPVKDKGVYRHGGLNTKLIASLADVMSVVETGRAQICDVRPEARWRAQAPEPRAGVERGHIPGSLNIPSTLFLEENDVTKFRSVEALAEVLEDRGVVKSAKVICSCGSGITAAVGALARHATGVKEHMSPIYDGSWTEYGSLPDTPKIVLATV